jgi:hypothetical protein
MALGAGRGIERVVRKARASAEAEAKAEKE